MWRVTCSFYIMGTERPNYMPNEKAFEPVEIRSSIDADLDPEKIILQVGRRFCEPSEKLYRNASNLKDDPLKAIESVDWTGSPLTEIKDPIDGLVVAAAKLHTAQNELPLNPKQKEHFEGFRQNIEGAVGFLGALESTIKSKVIRTVASGATVVTMALSAAGCGNVVGSYVEITPNTSPPVEVTDIPIETPTSFSTPETFSTETETPLGIEVAPYPTSAENFVKMPSISGAEAEKRIVELGAGEDLFALKDWYKANGIASSNMLPVVYEEGGEVHWDLAAKGTNGNFLKFTITSGKETNQLVRAMGMVAYLYNRPEFKVSELIKPAELNGTAQQMIWDKSGWSVIGAFKGESLVGWFNADKNMWIMEQTQEVEITPTPEYETIHSSLEIEGSVEGLPVKINFSIAQDTYDREVKPLDRWEYNSVFVEKYGEDEAKNLMAEIIMKAHLFAWQEDDWENRKSVTLSDYIQRIKDGENMSYEIYATNRGSIIEGEKRMVDPTKPVDILLSQKIGGDLWGGQIDALSMFLYVDNGSLTMELFANPEYWGFGDIPKDSFFITLKMWELIAQGPMLALSHDIKYQMSGNVSDEEIANYQELKSKERPELDQLNFDFYRYDDYYSNNPTMVPLRVRER